MMNRLAVRFYSRTNKGLFKHELRFEATVPPSASFLASDNMPGCKDTTDAAGAADYLYRLADTVDGTPWRLWERPDHSHRPWHLKLPDIQLSVTLGSKVKVWGRSGVAAKHWSAYLDMEGHSPTDLSRRDVSKLLRSLACAMKGNCEALIHCYDSALTIQGGDDNDQPN